MHIQNRQTWLDKIIKFITRISIFLTILMVVIFIPYGVMVAIYYLILKQYLVTFIYIAVVILLLYIHSKVV
jgi:hypothetical protein